MKYYSYYVLNDFEKCPLMYKFKYVDNKIFQQNKRIESFLGDRYHEAMEKLYENIRLHTIPINELLQYYESNWQRKYNNSIFVPNGYKPDSYKNLGKAFIKDYYKKHIPFNTDIIVYRERKVRFDLYGDGKYIIKGRPDRIDDLGSGKYEIHDYKTSQSEPPSQLYFDTENYQLAIYQLGLENEWSKDIKDVTLVWHYVAFNKEIRSKKTKEQLSQIKEKIKDIIKQIEETKKFEAKENELCTKCYYRKDCPQQKHLFVNGFTKEEGSKLVEKFIDLKKRKDELKKTNREIRNLKTEIKDFANKYNYDNLFKDNYKLSITKNGNVELKQIDNENFET